MKHIFIFTGLFFLLHASAAAQVKAGDQAPPFVINRGDNAIQGISMPYLNKIVLLHFWSSQQKQASQTNKHLGRLYERYSEADYINAAGFEIIAVAIQHDQDSWKQSIERDSISHFIHGIAGKNRSEDDVCKKFGIENAPADLLIDENGKVVLVNPRLTDVENYLDEKKNVHPIRKDIFGWFAFVSDTSQKFKFSRVYLFNHYGDSLGYTRCNEKGVFTFHDLKLNQFIQLRLDNQADFLTSDPVALYSVSGEEVMKGEHRSAGFVFNIPPRLNPKLHVPDSSVSKTTPLEVSFSKHLDFMNNGTALSSKDEKELQGILNQLKRNNRSILEFGVHMHGRNGEAAAKASSDKQAQSIRAYFLKNGIEAKRMRYQSFGNTSPLVPCAPNCSEEDHHKNKRVEFTILKT